MRHHHFVGMALGAGEEVGGPPIEVVQEGLDRGAMVVQRGQITDP
jgi:folate-dependent phosphoribosylglycinamide formyltransferase PurN